MSGELAAVDECTCGHLWDQHYAAAGRQGFCLSHCGCRGFIWVGRKSAVHLAAGRPEMPDHDEYLHRLRRRGTLTITTQGDTIEVRFKALGPYGGRGWCTTDTVDLFQHCRLGAKDWHGEGFF